MQNRTPYSFVEFAEFGRRGLTEMPTCRTKFRSTRPSRKTTQRLPEVSERRQLCDPQSSHIAAGMPYALVTAIVDDTTRGTQLMNSALLRSVTCYAPSPHQDSLPSPPIRPLSPSNAPGAPPTPAHAAHPSVCATIRDSACVGWADCGAGEGIVGSSWMAVVMISELLVEIVAMAQRKLKPSLGWRRRSGSVNRVRDSGAVG